MSSDIKNRTLSLRELDWDFWARRIAGKPTAAAAVPRPVWRRNFLRVVRRISAIGIVDSLRMPGGFSREHGLAKNCVNYRQIQHQSGIGNAFKSVCYETERNFWQAD